MTNDPACSVSETPNAATMEAMRQAAEEQLSSFSSIAELLADLNAED